MMEREEEKPKAYKVDDRRRFSSEGDLKPEFQGGEPAPASESVKPSTESATGVVAGEPVQYASGETGAPIDSGETHPPDHSFHAEQEDHTEHDHAGHDHGAHAGHAHEAGPSAEITFGTFLVSLSTQALMLLGDIPDPQTGRPQQDLVAAEQLIDIIGMLQKKTQGNLDREEVQLIDAILYELRMKYVERARTAR